ncbi:unnamed protein product [Prorocentrum cordatum]|uniref:EF-hand domain-containing protein n=1 Tax=Prorocentrum cordatum TaxID=2364126 RepID=A0ABN9XVL0_9DINO|nr:unnamed protein product [Polarella glacialis]
MALFLAAAVLLAAPAAVAAQAAPDRRLRGATGAEAAGDGQAAALASDPLSQLAGLFSALDRDGDGALSPLEVAAGAGAAQGLAADLFGAADADGSGAVGLEELGALAEALQRRRARAGAGRGWEGALLKRAAAPRAVAEEAPAQAAEGALEEVLNGKDLWTPHNGCEMYTLRTCGAPLFPGWHERRCPDPVSTCNDDGDCVCPDGYCSSTRMGFCDRCDDWSSGADVGNSSCIHTGADMVPYPHEMVR